MLNHIVLMGRLTKEPELRYTQSSTPVASFTVAVDRDYQKDQVDFIDCVAWRKTGEFVGNYFHKGQMIVVSGSLQSRKWEDRDGNKRTNWEVNADQVYFGEAKRREDSGPSQSLRDSSPRRGASQEYGNPNVLDDMGSGYGQGNPFVGGVQQSFDDEDGELPF